MMAETQAGRPGGTLAVSHLAHLMLLQAFRLHLLRQAGDHVGLLYALAETQLGRAIEAMHADPSHRWTLAELANRAGLSRSVFAQRFRERVGETPIRYPARWRMMLPRERLVAGREPLGMIAAALGYEFGNAFNTAFRRLNGCSPICSARIGRSPHGDRRERAGDASSRTPDGGEKHTGLARQRHRPAGRFRVASSSIWLPSGPRRLQGKADAAVSKPQNWIFKAWP